MFSLLDSDPLTTQAVLDSISRQIAAAHTRAHGHPPRAARGVWDEDVVVCVLDGVLTEAERGLVERGRHESMRAERLARHEPLAPALRRLVERLTGRPVRAYMTEVGPEGVASEVFILA
jgi:uncharacterized protein YbcI